MTENKVISINWNRVEDMIDKATYTKLTEQFWLSTRIPVANDMDNWEALPRIEKQLFKDVFGGLTMLDTLQSEVGAVSLLPDIRTQHESAVLGNIIFMEGEHAKSYSTIFSTFCTPSEIDDIFKWTLENEYLQHKGQRVRDIYLNGTPLERKIASVLLESFLFYSGFYLSLRYLGQGQMTNTAEVINLILRDEAVHATYIGYKFRQGYEEASPAEQARLKDFTMELASELFENEVKYTKSVYSYVGWVYDVVTFLEYNLNKALDNLGFDPIFDTTAKDVNPLVINGLSTSTSNHDFFSQVGNGYLMGQVETYQNDDFAILDNLI